MPYYRVVRVSPNTDFKNNRPSQRTKIAQNIHDSTLAIFLQNIIKQFQNYQMLKLSLTNCVSEAIKINSDFQKRINLTHSIKKLVSQRVMSWLINYNIAAY